MKTQPQNRIEMAKEGIAIAKTAHFRGRHSEVLEMLDIVDDLLRDYKTWQQQVREFMEKAGQACPPKPCFPTNKIQKLREDLIGEELCELGVASHKRDIVEVADALVDLLYVVIGAACAYGIDLAPLWDEVHRSNMTKFIDGYRREDGKWVKGPSYSPANLKPILKAQAGK